MSNNRAMPNIMTIVDPKVRAALQALYEIVEIGRGNFPPRSTGDRWITRQELIETGILGQDGDILFNPNLPKQTVLPSGAEVESIVVDVLGNNVTQITGDLVTVRA